MTEHAEIAARLAAATPGPWPEDYVYEAVRHIRRNCDFIESRTDPEFTWDDFPDSAFIAHAPSDIAFLLAEITRLEAETDRKQAGWDACTAGLEELDRRLATAEAEIATLRGAARRLIDQADHPPEQPSEVEPFLTNMTRLTEELRALATPTATAREGGEG